jgi:hypothetical protein
MAAMVAQIEGLNEPQQCVHPSRSGGAAEGGFDAEPGSSQPHGRGAIEEVSIKGPESSH